ncbi:XdhC family protein [Paenibacillus sp. SI8]|uniref:XdhC family protein n=1 Tax=unclassified Paenibacillus TaxID=185978 RepID=UPI00346632E8
MEAYDILAAVEEGIQDAVLVTVIYVEGHAYRKQGAMMLLMEDGCSLGSISPGCLEADLAEYGAAVRGSGKPQMVEYDMRPSDDFGWGETIGCGGLLRILLEPVAGALKDKLLSVKAGVDNGAAVGLARSFADSYATIRYELFSVKEAGSSADSTDSTRLTELSTYTSYFKPKPRVVVFGANQDAMPLVQLALHAGFRVIVADWRETLCTPERFPGAQLAVAFPDCLFDELNLNERDYVVVMSHQYQKDAAFVQRALTSKLRYLGIMGSTERTENMLEGLERPTWLHYPVGLRIGSEGPIENAISIVAELISIRRAASASASGEWCSAARGGDVHRLGVGSSKFDK